MRAFDPWVGERYWSEGINGIRVLILGESQYIGPDIQIDEPRRGTDGPADKISTQQIVRYLAIEKRSRFFTAIAKLVLAIPAGGPLTDTQRQEFWRKVAFYNYVQWWMPKARIRPSEEMWLTAKEPFQDVLHELKPNLVIVLGVDLARALPEISAEFAVVKINHPSSKGFTYAPWAVKIQSEMNAVRVSARPPG